MRTYKVVGDKLEESEECAAVLARRAYRDYVVTMKHDAGRVRIQVAARDEEHATELVCRAETAPRCAVVSVVVRP